MKRFELRIPDELHRVLKVEAQHHGISLHQPLLQNVYILWTQGLECWHLLIKENQDKEETNA